MPIHIPYKGQTRLWLNRIYPCSQKELFNCWINQQHLQHWWGPHHFTTSLCLLEPVIGGHLKIQMHAPDGMLFSLRGKCNQVLHSFKFVFTSIAFEDEPGYGFETLNTVLFLPLGRKTMLYFEMEILNESLPDNALLQFIEEGWKQSLEKLEEYLTR